MNMNKSEVLLKLSENIKKSAELLEIGDLPSLIEYFYVSSVGYSHIPSIAFSDGSLPEYQRVAEGINEILTEAETDFYIRVPDIREDALYIYHKSVPIWIGNVDLSKKCFTVKSTLEEYITAKINEKANLEAELKELLAKKFFKSKCEEKAKHINDLISKCEAEIQHARKAFDDLKTKVYPAITSIGLSFNPKNSRPY